MRSTRIRIAGCIDVALFATFSVFASADTVTIGSTGGGNAFPFGYEGYVGEYQQIYNGSLFSGTVLITGITFFPVSSTYSISGDYTIDLSTTSATPGNISNIFAANIGADNAQFFSGTVTNVLSFTGGPFLYDPSRGNLLLDVDVLSPNPSAGSFLIAGCSTDTNRVFNNIGGVGILGSIACMSSDPTVKGNGGLETEFTYTPVNSVASTPEPSTLALLGTGLIGAMLETRRRIAMKR
jgi:hypothetical protein